MQTREIDKICKLLSQNLSF